MQRKVELDDQRLSNVLGTTLLSMPTPLGLVLSGGGAKGIAYAGLVRTLELKKSLNDLRSVAGSSAGALTASLIAFGFNSKDIEYVISHTNFDRLRYNKSFFSPVSGQRLRNYLELIFITQLSVLKKKFGLDYPEQLKTKISIIEEYFQSMTFNIQSLQDIVNLSDQGFEDLDLIYMELDRIHPSIRLTFSDLGLFANLVNHKEPNFIKNLYVAIHNNSAKQLMKCCHQTTPELSIALAVQTSSALPPLYESNFIDGYECNDGGIIDNMPAQMLIEEIAPERLLCIKVETEEQLLLRKQKASQAEIEQVQSLSTQFIDFITEKLFSFKDGEITARSINQEKIFYYMDNMLYLSSNQIKTTSSAIELEERQEVIEKAAIQTAEFLWARKKYYSHPLLAMIHLSNQCIDEYRENEDFKAYIQMLTDIRDIQTRIVHAIKAGLKEELPELLNQFKLMFTEKLNVQISDDDKSLIVLSLVHQINYQANGGLFNYFVEQRCDNDEQIDPWWQAIINWFLSFFSCISEYAAQPEKKSSDLFYFFKQAVKEKEDGNQNDVSNDTLV